MQWTIAFYANHSQEGAMGASWSESSKYCFYGKAYNFLNVILVSRLTISVTNKFQTN